MNVLLIQGYITATQPVQLSEPLGLVCLASYVEAMDQHGDFKVEILDLFALGHHIENHHNQSYTCGISDRSKIVEMVSAKKPDVIGIPCNFTTLTRGTYELINLLKREFPAAKLIVGGAHATIDDVGVLENTTADIVVRGEGEETFLETLCALRDDRKLEGIRGLTWREANGKIASNPDRPLIRDIDLLPIPNRKYIDQELYTSTIDKQTYFLAKGNRTASVMTSRGCPYNCVFCSTKVVWRREFRARSADLVLQEIDQLVKDYGIDEVRINDDQFFGDVGRVHKVMDMLIARSYKMNVYVLGGSSVWLVKDVDLLRKMKKAGVYRLLLPIETGNANTRTYIRKNIDFESVRDLVKTANRLGMWTYADFVIGFPYETREDIEETIKYATSLGLDFGTFFTAKAYAGSDMFEHFRKEKLLPVEDFSDAGEASCDTVHLKKEEIQCLLKKARERMETRVLLNYVNPVFFARYIFPKINTIDGFVYFIKYVYRILTTQIIRPAILHLRNRSN
jgi:anaerobic magnesium-protoporphyrin IX monomethyl ester cyclase